MVVVGRLPGTGVLAARNVRTAVMNKPTAKRTTPAPISAPTGCRTSGSGQAK
jgi:hypothetical protein